MTQDAGSEDLEAVLATPDDPRPRQPAFRRGGGWPVLGDTRRPVAGGCSFMSATQDKLAPVGLQVCVPV